MCLVSIYVDKSSITHNTNRNGLSFMLKYDIYFMVMNLNGYTKENSPFFLISIQKCFSFLLFPFPPLGIFLFPLRFRTKTKRRLFSKNNSRKFLRYSKISFCDPKKWLKMNGKPNRQLFYFCSCLGGISLPLTIVYYLKQRYVLST